MINKDPFCLVDRAVVFAVCGGIRIVNDNQQHRDTPLSLTIYNINTTISEIIACNRLIVRTMND